MQGRRGRSTIFTPSFSSSSISGRSRIASNAPIVVLPDRTRLSFMNRIETGPRK